MSSDSPAETTAISDSATPGDRYTLGQLVGYFLKLGALGFGGPVALVGYMHRELVERRAWISNADYREGLALAQLAPGPLAAQLAIYLGYVHYRILGATLVGLAFVLPSFVMVTVLGWAYQHYGGLSWMQAVFYGVGSCVIGIIAHSSFKLVRKTIARDVVLWLAFLASAVCTIVTETEYVAVFLIAGLVTWFVKTRLKPGQASGVSLPMLLLAVAPVTFDNEPTQEKLSQIAIFFFKAGAFVFGSGLAIVPFLYAGVVNDKHWLDNHAFLDAVAVAMITPGPVVITVAFIGYLIAGFWGAVVAAVATFLPCYLFTVLPAPYFKKYGRRPGIVAFVDGVTAAAVGAISGAVVVLGRRTLLNELDQPQAAKILIALATVALLASGRKIPEPLVVVAAALIGLAIY